MLRATKALLEILARDAELKYASSARVTADVLCDIVLRFGSRDDADALLPVFLANPMHLTLPILQIHGSPETGRRLFEAMVTVDGLRDGCSADVLQAIGYLGYEPATSTLWMYAREAAHAESRAACLGLLDLPCNGIRCEISETFRSLRSKTLFQEFLPTVAVKAQDPKLLTLLMELAEDTSSDYIGGVLVGVAAFGAPAVGHFQRFLREKRWEAFSEPTGTASALEMGFYGLGLRVTELFDGIRADLERGADHAEIHYRLNCMFALLPWNTISTDILTGCPRLLLSRSEPLADIYDKLFGEGTGSELSLSRIIEKLPEASDPYFALPKPSVIEDNLRAVISRQETLKAMRVDWSRFNVETGVAD